MIYIIHQALSFMFVCWRNVLNVLLMLLLRDNDLEQVNPTVSSSVSKIQMMFSPMQNECFWQIYGK